MPAECKVLGLVHLTHPTASERAHDSIISDHRAGNELELGRRGASQLIGRRRVVVDCAASRWMRSDNDRRTQKAGRPHINLKQGLDLLAQREVPLTRTIEKITAVCFRTRECLVKQLFDT